MFGDVPVQTAVVCCCALGDVDAGYAEGFLGDFEWGGGRGDGEVSGDEHEFVVGAWNRQSKLNADKYMEGS